MRNKSLLAAALLSSTAAWVATAHADPTLEIKVQDGSTTLTHTGQLTPSGSLTQTFTDSNFRSIEVTIQGWPTFGPNPDISSTAIAATAASGLSIPAQLTVWVTQINITKPNTTTLNFVASGTLNGLTGGTNWGTVEESQYVDDANNPFGEGTDVYSTNIKVTGPTTKYTSPVIPVTLSAEYSDSQVYTVPFLVANESFNGSAQLTALIPEPASLSMLGSGLLAFGAWRRRKKSKS